MSVLLLLLLLVPRDDVAAAEADALTPAMRAWARAAVDETASPAERLGQLRDALRRRGVRSAPGSETPTAAETFARGRTDCVGYALLLVALAREVGVPAGYVLFERFPGAAPRRAGDLRVVEGHLAVALAGDDRAWDADGVLDAAAGRRVADSVALAVFHSNRGVARLLGGDVSAARRWLRRAVALAPDWDLGRHHLALAEGR